LPHHGVKRTPAIACAAVQEPSGKILESKYKMAVSKGPLVFQTFAWETDDGLRDGEENLEDAKFSVQMFGKTAGGQSVSVRVDSANGGFNPSFAISVPESCADQGVYDQLFDLLKRSLIVYDVENAEEGKPLEKLADLGEHLVLPDEPVVRRVDFWGFTNRKPVPFFQFAFTSDRAYRMALSKFRACHKNKLPLKDLQYFIDEYNSIGGSMEDIPWDERPAARARFYEEKREFLKAKHDETGAAESLLRWVLKLDKEKLPLELVKVKLYEVIDHNLRFAHMGGVRPAGWISIDHYELVDPEERETTCAIEANCNLSDLRAVEQNVICPALKEMAFDIEAYSHDDAFPNPEHPSNCAFQIAVTVKEYVQTDMKKILLHLVPPGSQEISLPDVDVRNYHLERDLLIAFRDIILTEDPDMIWGWNSDSFDWSFLMKRAEVNDCTEEFSQLSRKVNHACKVEKEHFSSSAQGDNEFERVKIPGRLNFDAMTWVKRNMGNDFPDHKLDTVASIKLGETKRDVHHREIFAAFRSGDAARCVVIGDYCVQDTALVQKLVVKLNMVTQIFAMSNITDTPPAYLLTKGQQIKCLSVITKRARQKGYFVPVADSRSGDSFEGAIVLDPKVGIYDTPTACLDFASLYPSIQMAYQICYTTIVLVQCPNCKKGQGPCMRDKGVDCYDNLPDVKYETFSWDEDVVVHTNPKTKWRRTFNSADSAKRVTGTPKKEINDAIAAWRRGSPSAWSMERVHRRYRFAQGQNSIIPDLQVELKGARSAVRRVQASMGDLKDAEERLRYSVLDGQQLAYKVTGNSLYGFTSAYALNLQALGACTTARGRQMIARCVRFANDEFQKIAEIRCWTQEDVRTWITNAGKEKVTDTPEKGWARKYPAAVEGLPWSLGKILGANVIGGDTDSIFCNFSNCTVSEAFSVSRKMEEVISEEVFNRHPIQLEAEKVWSAMIICGKKMYAGLKHEKDDVRFKEETKGLATKRRNYCGVVKEFLWELIYGALGVRKEGKTLIKIPVIDRNRADALLILLRNCLERFVTTESLPWDDLVITSSLRASYTNENLPHVEFARRMNEREKGGGPRVGERFGFVYVHASRAGDDTETVAEDPTYAKQNRLLPNRAFYLDHQLRGPLTTLLNVAGRGKEAEALFNEMSHRLHEVTKSRRRERERDAKQRLLSGKMPQSLPPLKAPKAQKKFTKTVKGAGPAQKITYFFHPVR